MSFVSKTCVFLFDFWLSRSSAKTCLQIFFQSCGAFSCLFGGLLNLGCPDNFR